MEWIDDFHRMTPSFSLYFMFSFSFFFLVDFFFLILSNHVVYVCTPYPQLYLIWEQTLYNLSYSVVQSQALVWKHQTYYQVFVCPLLSLHFPSLSGGLKHSPGAALTTPRRALAPALDNKHREGIAQLCSASNYINAPGRLSDYGDYKSCLLPLHHHTTLPIPLTSKKSVWL